MLTEKDYCDYDTCVALMELGLPFDWHEDETWHDNNSNILLYEAQKWLREEKRICVEVDCCAGGYVWELCKAYHKDWFSGGTTIYDNAIDAMLNDCGRYDSYEEALSEGVRRAVKILKEK